ncbi:MAG: lipopolysaccharide biosynthesis protein [Methylacidiphilales bacterium]|nr:lipopolysaccharide biosynthesis protein [Candidatus Methylacidiphilales bacterium]
MSTKAISSFERYAMRPVWERISRILSVAFLRFLAVGLSLVFSIFAARMLGVTEFGRYTSIMAVVGLFIVATSAGLPQLVEREVAAARGKSTRENLKPLLQAAFLLLLVALFALVATALVLDVTSFLVAILIVASLCVGLLGGALTGYERVSTVAIIQSLVRPLVAIIALSGFAVATGKSLDSALLAQVTATIVAVVALLVVFRSVNIDLLRSAWKEARSDWRPNVTHRAFVLAGMNFAIIQLMINATQQAEILYLTILTNPDQVAYFFAVSRAGNAVSFFHASVLALHAPTIVRLNAEGRHVERDREIMRATKLSFVLTFLAAIGAALLAGPYLHAFGPAFIEAKMAMYVILFGWVAAAAFGPSVHVLIMNRQERFVWRSYAISFTLGGCIALICIPMLGIVGAAISCATTTTISQLLISKKGREVIGFVPFCIFKTNRKLSEV